MKWTPILTLAVLLLAAIAAPASDPVGIYAVVDKVVTEPSDGPAERIQIWGAFALAKKREAGEEYDNPVRGYMYFSLNKDKEDACRKEWSDLKKSAGTSQCIAFGSRYDPKGTVRKAQDEPKKPDTYPVGFGMQKVGKDHPVAVKLFVSPSPIEPSQGDLVPAGEITLRIRNSAGSGSGKVKYLFVIEDESGTQEASGPIAPGEKETTWTPKMKLKPGGKYTWRVWTQDDKTEDKAGAATMTFKVKG